MNERSNAADAVRSEPSLERSPTELASISEIKDAFDTLPAEYGPHNGVR